MSLVSTAKAENLADALIGAYNTSGLLEQNRALLRAADEDVAVALSALRPIISWTMTAARTINDSTGVTGITQSRRSTDGFIGLRLEQLVYDGGAAQLNKQSAQETVLATRQTLLQVEQNVLFRAVVAYLNVLLQEENVRLRENNVRVLGEELRAAQDRFDVGEVTRTDVALAESRLANARSNLVAARGILEDAKAEYTAAVGRAPGRLERVPSLPKAPATVGTAHNLAMRNHPSVLSAQHQVTSADLRARSVQKNLGPTVSLFGDVGVSDRWNSQVYSEGAAVELNFRQPIYAGGGLAANYRRALASRDAAKANLITVQRDVIQDVTNAYVRLETADASLEATRERVRAAQVAFDGIREEATLGARTTLDVLTAEQDLLDAQTAEISAIAERAVAAYDLLVSQGLLTAERLGLAVQIYDPTLYYNLVKDAPASVSKRSKDLDRVLEAIGKK